MKLWDMLCGLVVTMILFSCLVAQNLAIAQQQECMNELRFCLSYLNGSSQSPDRCCQPLDYVVKSIPECFCSLMSTLGVTQVEQLVGVNASKVMTLPSRCVQEIDPLGCITGTSDPRSRNSTPNCASFGLWSSSLIIVVASSIILIF